VITGVGAGKFLEVRWNFARIIQNLPEKYFTLCDLKKRFLIRAQCDLQKKLFMSIRAPLFSNQTMLGAIFAQIFSEF